MAAPVVAFEVAGERYGIEARGVVEVVPAVPLRTVPGTVEGVVGLLRFRGALVPVVDLGVVWAKRPSPARMSTRIVVCDLPGEGGSTPGAATGARARVGLRAENVLHVTSVDPDASEAGPGPKTPGAKGLGRLVRDGDALLQLVRVGDLVPAHVLASLVQEAEAVAGGDEGPP